MKPLYKHEAEEALIGSILINSEALIYISEFMISPADFYLEKLGWIFEVMQNLHDAGAGLDLVTISDELDSRGQLDQMGAPYLTELANRTPTHMHAQHYAEIVKRDSLRRQMERLAGDAARLAHSDKPVSEMVDEIQTGLTELLSGSSRKTGAGLKDVMSDLLESLAERAERGGIVGVPSGLAELDNLLGGFQPGGMYTIAGRPGMGKSAFALSIAKRAAEQRKQVLFFSLEMKARSIGERLMSMATSIDSRRIKEGKLDEAEWQKVIEAGRELAQQPLEIIDDYAVTVAAIRQQAIAHWARYGLDMIVVDYLQLMGTSDRYENRQAEVSAISRALKTLAGELNVPVIALSQLNRGVEARADKRPMLADLRESGAIEQDSDVVMFLYRDDMYNAETEFPNIAEIIVAKHRDGATGTFSVYFRKEFCHFVDLELRSQPLEY